MYPLAFPHSRLYLIRCVEFGFGLCEGIKDTLGEESLLGVELARLIGMNNQRGLVIKLLALVGIQNISQRYGLPLGALPQDGMER